MSRNLSESYRKGKRELQERESYRKEKTYRLPRNLSEREARLARNWRESGHRTACSESEYGPLPFHGLTSRACREELRRRE